MCPTYETFPICWASSVYGEWRNDTCTPTNFDALSTDCNCELPLLHRRRRHLAETMSVDGFDISQYHTEFRRQDYDYSYELIDQTLSNRRPGEASLQTLAIAGVIFVLVGAVFVVRYDLRRKRPSAPKNCFFSVNWYVY